MVFLNWPVAISVIQLSVGILAGATAFTNYWGVIPSESIHFGLSVQCDKHYRCREISGTEDVIGLLIAVMCIGTIVSLPCCILEFFRGLRCNLFYCFASGLMALLAFAAMIHAVVVFSSIPLYFYYSWSFGLGWLTVIIAVASGVLSFFTRQKGTTDPEAPAAPPVEGNQQHIDFLTSNTGKSFPVIIGGLKDVQF